MPINNRFRRQDVFIVEDLDVKGLVSAGSWRSADVVNADVP